MIFRGCIPSYVPAIVAVSAIIAVCLLAMFVPASRPPVAMIRIPATALFALVASA